MAAGVTLMNEIGLDPGIDHLSAMEMIDSAHARGGKVRLPAAAPDVAFPLCSADAKYFAPIPSGRRSRSSASSRFVAACLRQRRRTTRSSTSSLGRRVASWPPA